MPLNLLYFLFSASLSLPPCAFTVFCRKLYGTFPYCHISIAAFWLSQVSGVGYVSFFSTYCTLYTPKTMIISEVEKTITILLQESKNLKPFDLKSCSFTPEIHWKAFWDKSIEIFWTNMGCCPPHLHPAMCPGQHQSHLCWKSPSRSLSPTSKGGCFPV